MIKSLNLKLSNGEFQIIEGIDFFITSKEIDHLIYEKNGVWHIESDPCAGKLGNTTITIPNGYIFENIRIILDNAVLTMCNIHCTNIEFDIRNSTSETNEITSQYLSVKTSRGDIRAKANSILTDIDCGHGTVDLHFTPHSHGYKINSICGMGNITHNSMTLPKKYTSSSGVRKINIICGMGKVNFYT